MTETVFEASIIGLIAQIITGLLCYDLGRMRHSKKVSECITQEIDKVTSPLEYCELLIKINNL